MEVPEVNKPRRACLYVKFYIQKPELLFQLRLGGSLLNQFYQALISTSTPEGKSNLLKASTVLDDDV